MSRKFFRFFLVAALTLPAVAGALNCSDVGYTVMFVNGILNTESDADKSSRLLESRLPKELNKEPVKIILGYNPSHLGGVGDLTQSFFQAFNAPINSYDLNTILMQLHPQITTRKILLVGHSQGAFYTNELYNYLTTHGVPKESIAVYNIATPASYVAGGGQYVTSSNDKVMNAIRDWEVSGNVEIHANSNYLVGGIVASALRANITLPKEEEWSSDQYGGHHFSLYLNGATQRIVGDIQRALRSLKTEPSDDGVDGCFIVPQPTLAYKVEQAFFALGDSVAGASASLSKPIQGSLALLSGTRGLLADVLPSFATAFAQALGLEAGESQAALAALPDSQPKSIPVNTPSQSKTVAKPQAILPEQKADPVIPPAEPEVQPSPIVEETPSNIQTRGTQHFVTLPISPAGGGGGTVAPSVPTNAPSLSVTAPLDGSFHATSSIVFSGTADAGAMVTVSDGTNEATTTADAVGAWTITTPLLEGENALSVSSGNAAPISRTITVDLTPPASTTLSIAGCDLSLSDSYCLLPVSSTDVSWTDATDAVSYDVLVNGSSVASLSGTSTAVTLASGASTTISIASSDRAGNQAISAEITVGSVSRPLIFNEIGWAGDIADHANQWVELKNLTSQTLNLSHVVLTRSGGTDIALSGTLPADSNPYFVIEPIAVSGNGSHIFVTSFALSTTSAEQLSLVWNGNVLDQTPAAAACGASWCAGKYLATLGSNVEGNPDLISPLSMERRSDSLDGTDASAWRDTDSYAPWLGTGGYTWGTPGVANSFGLPESGVYCGSPGNLVPANSQYHPAERSCVYLSRFITGGGSGVYRFNALYRGTVTNSANVSGSGVTRALASTQNEIIPPDAQAGEEFFFAIWEQRNGPAFNADNTVFDTYFTTGSSTPPHGNYVTIPWIYQ